MCGTWTCELVTHMCIWIGKGKKFFRALNFELYCNWSNRQAVRGYTTQCWRTWGQPGLLAGQFLSFIWIPWFIDPRGRNIRNKWSSCPEFLQNSAFAISLAPGYLNRLWPWHLTFWYESQCIDSVAHSLDFCSYVSFFLWWWNLNLITVLYSPRGKPSMDHFTVPDVGHQFCFFFLSFFVWWDPNEIIVLSEWWNPN